MATPYSLTVLEVVPSTQDAARTLAADDGGAAVVVARRQTEGRGRSGAEWLTAPSAVAVSVAFTPSRPVDEWPLLPLIAGVASLRVLEGRACLKWPNDVLIGDAKVGGILLEAHEGLVVAGLGLNLCWPEPPEGIGGLYPADPGSEGAVDLAEAWAGAFLELAGAAGWPRGEYVAACSTLGQEIAWSPAGSGRAVDIDQQGRLVVLTPAGKVRLTAGEVRHLRPGHGP